MDTGTDTTSETTRRPDALLFTGPGCPYCAAVKKALTGLEEQGLLGRLEVVDAASEPGRAETLGVRSVPWLNLGGLILEGAHTQGELRSWLERLADGSAWPAYLDQLLSGGALARVEAIVRQRPGHLADLLPLIAEPETPMATRVGIGALLEGLAGSGQGARLVDGLSGLVHHDSAQVRADACHYLSLTESADALPLLETCMKDDDATVREIAEEGIEHLRAVLAGTG